MEQNISDELQEAFETGRWKVRKFALPNATKFGYDYYLNVSCPLNYGTLKNIVYREGLYLDPR